MSDRCEQACDLGEEALEALDKGDEMKADALIEQAKTLDKTALEELAEDLDEGAGKTPADQYAAHCQPDQSVETKRRCPRQAQA